MIIPSIPNLFVRDPNGTVIPKIADAQSWVILDRCTVTRLYSGPVFAYMPVIDGELSVHGVTGILGVLRGDEVPGRWMVRAVHGAHELSPKWFTQAEFDVVRKRVVGWVPVEESEHREVFEAAVTGQPYPFDTFSVVDGRLLSHWDAEVFTGEPFEEFGQGFVEMGALPNMWAVLLWLSTREDCAGVVWKHPIAGTAKLTRADAAAVLALDRVSFGREIVAGVVAAPTQPG